MLAELESAQAQLVDQRPPDPERLEQMKQRMRDRGLSEEEIEERLSRFRQQGAARPESR